MNKTIKNFRTKDQREFDKICEKSEDNLKEYNEMLERKERKFQMGGKLSEADIDEIIKGMGILARDSIDRKEQLKKINPEEYEKMRKEEKEVFNEAWVKAKEEYFEEEHGMKVVK